MALIYCRLDVGSDSNLGTSRADAFLTLAFAFAAAHSGDRIRVSGTGWGGGPVDRMLSNITLEQDPDGSPWLWLGYTVLATGGWVATGAAWELSNVEAPNPDALTWDYLNQVNALGSHQGTLDDAASAAAVVAGAVGAAWLWFYDAADRNGTLTAYFGGANPNTAGKTIAYVARRNVSAIKLIGTGNVISGGRFKAWHNSVQGAPVWLEDSSGSGLIEDISVCDAGPHTCIFIGQTVAMSNNTIRNCSSRGGKQDGSHFTFYGTNAAGNTSALLMDRCYVERHTHLTPAGVEIDGCTQTGFYAHSDTGTPIRGLVYRGCIGHDQSVVDAPMASAAVGSPTDAANPLTYRAYATECTFTGMSRSIVSNAFAFIRCVLRFDRCGSSGKCRYGGLGCFGYGGTGDSVKCEATELYFNAAGDGANSIMCICIDAAAQDFRFTNCSIAATPPSAGGGCYINWIQNFAGANLDYTGCIISFTSLTGDVQGFAYSEPSTTTAMLDMDDNIWGLFSHYGVGAVSFAAPGTEDAHAITVATNPFTQHATDLRIVPGSSAYGKRRATSSNVPAGLIGGGFDMSFGGYPDPAGARHRMPPWLRGKIEAHNAAIRRRAG